MRPGFLHYRSFWLGLPVFLFLVWGWVDSVRYDTRANFPHGPVFNKESKTTERVYYPDVESLRKIPDLTIPSFDLSAMPSDEGNLPLMPRESPPIRIIDPQLRTTRIPVQRCVSVGNKEGTLWISHWDAPTHPKDPWRRIKTGGEVPWLATFQYQGGESPPTLWLPYWMILAAYTLPWVALILWRRRLRRITWSQADTPS